MMGVKDGFTEIEDLMRQSTPSVQAKFSQAVGFRRHMKVTWRD